jgi:hypothetical protein
LLPYLSITNTPITSWPPPSPLQAERSLPDEFLLELDLERLRVVEVKQPTLQALLQGEAANQVRALGGGGDHLCCCTGPAGVSTLL